PRRHAPTFPRCQSATPAHQPHEPPLRPDVAAADAGPLWTFLHSADARGTGSSTASSPPGGSPAEGADSGSTACGVVSSASWATASSPPGDSPTGPVDSESVGSAMVSRAFWAAARSTAS